MNSKFKVLLISGLAFIALSACTNDLTVPSYFDPGQSTDILSSQDTKTMADTAVPTDNKFVLLKTNMGEIKVELFNSTMPVTAGNFQKLVEEKFYNGIIFHRVIDGFMIQGGDPTGTGRGGPGYTIKDEFTKTNRNLRGTISMANAGPNTGGSQFFINLVDNSFLDAKHPVFGKVVSGMEVVDKIAKSKTDSSDRPETEVKIISAEIVAN